MEEPVNNLTNPIMDKLKPVMKKLHAVLLIGSRVTGGEEEGSDMDVVVISMKEHRSKVARYLWDLDTDEFQYKVQFVCFDPEQARKLFQSGSPMAHAIVNGNILKDNGFLKRLFALPLPSVPRSDYYVYAMEELIAMRYYDTLLRYERDIRKSHAPGGICVVGKECDGHAPADVLASLVMRMLYVTLPARGYMPLNKRDVLQFSVRVYGEEISQIIEKVSYLHRNNVIWITCDEYRLIKTFAVLLFKEVQYITGKEESFRILKKAATVMKKLPRI